MFFLSKSPKEALAQCVLAEIPQQVVNYFSTYKLQPPKNPAVKWMGWAGKLRLCACFTCCICRLWFSRYFCIPVNTRLCVVMSVSFCLQITLPNVPFKGQNLIVLILMLIWEIGLAWVHFILQNKSGKKEVEYAERRGRRGGSGTAACLINMASGSVQLLLWDQHWGLQFLSGRKTSLKWKRGYIPTKQIKVCMCFNKSGIL